MFSWVLIWFAKFCGIVHNTSCLVGCWNKQHQPVSSSLRHRLLMTHLCSFWRSVFHMGCLKNKYKIIFVSCPSKAKIPTSHHFGLLYYSVRAQFWFFLVNFMSLSLKQCPVPVTTFPSNHVRFVMKKTLIKSVLMVKLPTGRTCVCLSHCFILSIQHWDWSWCLKNIN